MEQVNYEGFFSSCKKFTGLEVKQAADLAPYSLDLSGFERTVSGVVVPLNSAAVIQLVKTANEHKVPIYPISKGYNWGLGCKLPASDGCVIVDLGKLNEIREIDIELGTITLQPGVSLLEVEQAVMAKTDQWYLPATGAPPESSVIGNALERGDALGPNGDRFEHCCSLKVVIGTGDVITTGYGAFGQLKLGRLSKSGVGPAIQGLFCQSNYGIVIEMTLWLVRRPALFQPFISTLKTDHQLINLLTAIRNLQQEGLLKPGSWAIWNNFKMVASETQFPWKSQPVPPLHVADLHKTGSRWAKTPWIFLGGIYSLSRAHGKVDRKLLKSRVRQLVHSFIIFDPLKVYCLRALNRLFGKYLKLDIEDILKALLDKSVFLGHTTRKSSRTLYWRKPFPPTHDLNPFRDQCGLIWLCMASEFEAKVIHDAVKTMERIILAHGFEPQLAFIAPSERLIYYFPTIIFDAAISGEAARARACQKSILSELGSIGIMPYRLDIDSMKIFDQMEPSFKGLLKSLKSALDPNGIMSPGRYECKKNGVQNG